MNYLSQTLDVLLSPLQIVTGDYLLGLAGMPDDFVDGGYLGIASLSDVTLLLYCESPPAVHLIDNNTSAKHLQLLDSFVVRQ